VDSYQCWQPYSSPWWWNDQGREHVLLVGVRSHLSLRQRAHDVRVGEDKTNGSAFQNVNCYSSVNLVEWKYEGALLSKTSSGDLGPNRVVERPKVIYNKSTKKYVLWMHIDSSDYKEAKAGVATGDTVCGKYTYKGASQPLGFQSRDMGLFVDDNDKAYLLTEDVSHLSLQYEDESSSTMYLCVVCPEV
jgi:beta-xylosidase